MNQDPNNPDNLQNTNHVDENPVVVTSPQSTSHKKLIILLVAFLVVACAAATALFVWPGFLKDKSPAATPGAGTSPNSPPTTDDRKTYFYYSTSDSEKVEGGFKHKIVMVHAATGDKKEDTITTNYPYFTSSVGVNVPVQFEGDGEEYVVATSDSEGMEAGTPNTFTLYKGKLGSAPEIVLSGKDQQSIADWIYTLDGKEIYYVLQKWDAGRKTLLSTELHKVNFATKEDATIGTMDRPAGRPHSRLFDVSTDGSLRFYSSMADGLHETKFDRATSKITSKKVLNIAAYGQGDVMQNGLSPDGTKLLLQSGNNDRVTVYLADLSAGTAKELLKPTDTRIAYGNGSWSPDGASIAFNTYPFGINGQKHVGFKNELVTVDPATAKITGLVEDVSPGLDAADYTQHFVNAYGWSADGTHLAYTNSGDLAFYDLTQKKIVHRSEVFGGYFTFDSGAGYGWAKY